MDPSTMPISSLRFIMLLVSSHHIIPSSMALAISLYRSRLATISNGDTDLRPIDICSCDKVEIVSEDIEDDVSDDLANFAWREPGIAHKLEVIVIDAAPRSLVTTPAKVLFSLDSQSFATSGESGLESAVPAGGLAQANPRFSREILLSGVSMSACEKVITHCRLFSAFGETAGNGAKLS